MSSGPVLRTLWMAAGMVLSGAVAGCGQGEDPEALLIDYVERVENITDVDVLDTDDYRQQLRVYPDRRDRRLPLEDVRIGFLDFLALNECGLQELIGERNSSLGKVMPVSQQLIYEHRILVGARRCRRQLETKDENAAALIEKLDEIAAIKSVDLTRAYWNATFGSPEFEHMFSLAAAPMSAAAEAPRVDEVELALRHLEYLGEQLGREELEIESSVLEAHYQALNSRRLGGELLGALDLLRFYLDAAARAMETRLNVRPVCFNGRPTPKAKIFDNVFHKYYVGKVQPYLARVHRQSEAWLGSVNRIARRQQAQITPAFMGYFDAQLSMEAERALWPRYQRALSRHTDAWQQLLTQCGLMPVSSKPVQ